jgi:periplasmic protein CpxP/Spy
MTTLPKRALLATALATALVGLSATAIVQATTLLPAQVTAGSSLLAQATTPAQTAQPAAPDAAQRDAKHEQRRAERVARMQQKLAERQAAFKAELKITPAQEPAWNAFVARTQPQARTAMRQDKREDWSGLTTPERLDRMKARETARSAAMDQRADAIRSFYAALDAEQQKVFDSKRLPGFQRAGMQRQHGGKHHHFHRHGAHEGAKQPA